MIKYNNTNNASTTLTAGISPSSTTLIVENGDILPTAPFLLTLEHFDNEKVTVREIVKCIAKAGNILTIQRGAGTCVQDDSATPKAQNNTPHSFSVGDVASIYWTSEQVQDIQNEIEKKLNIDDFQAGTYVYGATSTGTDAYSITIPGTITSYQLGQVFRFMADVDNEGNATLNINGLGAVEIRKNHDKILDNGDIEAGQIVEVAYDGTYFQMNSQVATVVDLGSIDSLKMSGVVGELYTLDDELYLQDVSEDLDLTEGVTVINVGYDKEETHIQRIANGISGNTVSLYIAKVGSPVTNFNVEIRKGIYAEADGRAYWTGDSTQILASKSISYSSFTTDFQKITITFDENIELQRGELIDIVCYQSGVGDEKVKNTTNYYNILALDYQRGEGNSINYVDNGTITTSYIIAYCVGDFFCDKIFSKVKNTNIEAPLYQKYPGGTLGSNTGGYVQFPNISVTNKTSHQIACKINTDVTFRYSGSNLTFTFYYSFDNGTNRTSFDSHKGGTPYTIDKTINIPIGSTMILGERISGGSGTFETYYGDVKIETVKTIMKETSIEGKPVSIIPIGNDTSVVTEGIANGERYSQATNEKRFFSEQVFSVTLNNNTRGSYTFLKDGIYKISCSPRLECIVRLNEVTIYTGGSKEITIYDGMAGDVIDLYGGLYENNFTITYVSRNISIPA